MDTSRSGVGRTGWSLKVETVCKTLGSISTLDMFISETFTRRNKNNQRNGNNAESILSV